MKMKNIIALLLVALLLTGCGAKGVAEDSVSYDTNEMIAETGAAMDSEAVMMPESPNATVETGRKWIVTMDLSVETQDLDAALTQLSDQIGGFEGYVENQNIHNGSSYSGRRYRSATLTIRIPVAKTEEFTTQVGDICHVVSKNQQQEDVTLTYVATESRLNALKTEETRLLELLAQAENMSDLLQIEARLTDVRYELESVTSQLRVLENQVDYATIYLNIEEVRDYTDTEEEKTVWQRISGDFVDSLKGIGTGALELGIWILANLPYLVLFGGIGIAIVVIVKKFRKRKPKA
jgi:TolA-binding protein